MGAGKIEQLKNVVVTGANGYLGSHLVKALINKGYYVWAIVRSSESNTSKINCLSNCGVVVCPLSEINRLSELLPCKEVLACYHLAWASGSKLSKETVLSQEEYIGQSIHLMDAVSKKDCKRFVGVGSILETNANYPLPKHPNMAYAVAKDCTNKLLALRTRELGMQYTWCRLCGLYGNEDNTGNLVSYTISCLKEGRSPEYSSGSQAYSFIHVEDCADALVCIGEASDGVPGLMTIAGPECKTIKEYMTTIQKLIAPEVQLHFGARADDGIRYQEEWFDNRFLIGNLHFRYNHCFDDEITKYK